MASNNRNNVSKKAGSLNSRWLKNTLKSMGVAGTEVIKDLMPATSTTISSGSKLATDVAKTIRSNKGGARSIQRALKNNPGINMLGELVNNAVSDIKSGNFYNSEREMNSAMGDFGFDDLDSDDIFGDLDDYADEGNDVNVQNNFVSQGDNVYGAATLKAVQQQTEYNMKASKATVDAMVSISSATMIKTNELGMQMISELNAINKNLAAMVEYNNTNMTKFIEASIGFYEQMSRKSEESSAIGGPTSETIFGMNGGLDFSQYKEYVKNNIASAKDESTTGSMLNLIMQNKDMILGNPIGLVTKGIMTSLIPQVLKTSMEELDRSVKEVIPVVLERIGELGENDNSVFGGFGRTIGKIFGIKTERKDKFDTSKIEKGPIPYNGIANHTIVEIIPKYLRESNTYLREIAEAVTGKSGSEMEGKFTGFDWETGTFKNINEMRDNLYSQISDEVVSTIERSDFGKKLNQNADLLKNDKDKESYEKALQQFYTAMEMHKGALNFNNQDHMKELMEAVTASDNIKNLIKASIQDMKDSESSLWGSAYNAKRDATRKKNSIMTGFEEEASKNGLYQIDNGRTYDQYIKQRMKDNKSLVAATASQDASISGGANASGSISTSTPSLLQGILNTLNRGIYVQVKDKLEGGGTVSTSGSDNSATLDTATQKAIARHKRKQSKKAAKEGSYEDFKSQLEAQREAETEILEAGEDETEGTVSRSAAVAGKMSAFSKVLNGIINGNADQAWDAFMGSLQEKFHKAGQFLGEHFFNPMKEKLFGKKDENGYLDGGLFAGVNNRMKESFYSFRRMMTGKGYIDAEGNTIGDATEEEMGNTVVGKLKNMLGQVKEGISVRLFGTKEELTDEDGNPIGKDGGVVGKAKDKLISATASFHKGITGWKHALFGKDSDDEDEEEAGKKTLADFKKKASEVMPTAIAGGIAGGAFGLASGGLLGWAVGGPIGGALLGFGTGILSKSEKFQKFLFGETDDDGNEISRGIISKKVQDYVKENKKFLIGGAAIGAIRGTFTGGGLLGSLVGGPIAGAILGMGTSMLIKSDMFQKFLYGDAERGQLGLINTVKGMFGKFGKSKGIASGGKIAGMAGIGAGVGAITLGTLTNSGIMGLALGPAGPIGGAILGLGAAMLAQKDNFKEWLFGKTDEETGEHREGIIGQFKNMLTVSVFKPLGNNLKTIGEDFKTFLKYDILERFNLAIEPIGNAIFGTFAKIGGSLKEIGSKFGSYIKKDFLGNVVEGAKKIFEPLTGAVNVISSGLYKVGKTITGAPLAVLSAVTSPISLAIGNVAKTATKAVFKSIDLALVKPMHYLVLKPLGFVTKTVGNIVAAPFKLLGNVATAINDKVSHFTHHVKTFFAQIGSDFRKAVVYPFKKFGYCIAKSKPL